MKRSIFIILILLILTACTAVEVEVATVEAIRPLVTETGTRMPNPAATEDPPQLSITTNTPVPSQTSTSLPSATPTRLVPTLMPTTTPLPEYYDLPAWVSNPEINVFAAETVTDWRDGDYALTFFNAHTGERYDMPLEAEVSFRWLQKDDGIYLRMGFQQKHRIREVREINIETGKLDLFEEKLAAYDGVRDVVSPDGKYVGQIIENEDESYNTILINQETGQEIELVDLSENGQASRIFAGWSPDSQMLALQRIYWQEDDTIARNLTVYNTEGEDMGSFANVTRINWSPEPLYRLLYPDESGYENAPPCILDVLTGHRTCLDKIAQWQQEQKVEITNFKWSPDGRQVSFIFWFDSEPYGGGLCVYDLESEGISCPVMPTDLEREGSIYLYVRNHFWSPDSQYLAFFINPFPPSSDDGGFQSLVIVESDGENLMMLDPSFGYRDQWRP